jgi:hypothetical protein
MFKSLPLSANAGYLQRRNVFLLECKLSHAWASLLVDEEIRVLHDERYPEVPEYTDEKPEVYQTYFDFTQTLCDKATPIAMEKFVKTGTVPPVEDGVDVPYASWETASGTMRYTVAPNGDVRLEFRPRVKDGAAMAILDINAGGAVSLELAGYARLLETLVGGNGWRFKNADFKATTDGDWYAPLAERSWFETDPMNRQDRMWELLECSCRWFGVPFPARPVATALPPVDNLRVASAERW